MAKARRLNELPRIELKDMFIGLVSGNDKEIEIFHTLAMFTAYNMGIEAAEKYQLTEYITYELIDLLLTWLNGYDYDIEDKAWNVILETLNPDKIYDIIENIDSHTRAYNEIITPIDAIKYQSLKLLTRLV